MLKEKIDLIRKTTYAISMEGKYERNAHLNGFILQKPKFINNKDRKRQSCSFILYQFEHDQFGYAYVRTFNIVTYNIDLIEELKTIKNVAFVNCGCFLHWHPKLKTLYPQMFEMTIQLEINVPLENEYNKGDFNGKQKII